MSLGTETGSKPDTAGAAKQLAAISLPPTAYQQELARMIESAILRTKLQPRLSHTSYYSYMLNSSRSLAPFLRETSTTLPSFMVTS